MAHSQDISFNLGSEEIEAQELLKQAIVCSPAIWAIDYTSSNPVFLVVNTNYIAIRYVCSQAINTDDTKKQYPSLFGSMLLYKQESKYLQPKIELYGLFWGLHASHIWIIGVQNLTVEVDMKFIKGMLNNPDVQYSQTLL